MKLTTRNTQINDLPACLRLVEADYLGQEGRCPAKADLLRLWKHLLQQGLARSAVVEVTTLSSQTARIAGFGLTVCVNERFLREYQARPRPFLITAVLEAWQSGCAPFLDARALDQANRNNGVNLLGLHTCWSGGSGWSGKFTSDDLQQQQMVAVRDAMMGALFQFHRDVRIKTFCKEIYGDEELARYRQFGMEPWPNETFYAHYAQEEEEGESSRSFSSSRPYLMGIDRVSALEPV